MFSLFKMLLSLIAIIRYLKTNDEIILKKQVNTKFIFTVEDEELVASYKNFNKHVKERLRRFKAKGKDVCEYSGIHKCQLADTYRYFNNTCAFSNKNLTFDSKSLDHLIPLNNGGKNKIWNIVPMDKYANGDKGHEELTDWYSKQSFYSETNLLYIRDYQILMFVKYANIESDILILI